MDLSACSAPGMFHIQPTYCSQNGRPRTTGAIPHFLHEETGADGLGDLFCQTIGLNPILGKKFIRKYQELVRFRRQPGWLGSLPERGTFELSTDVIFTGRGS